MASERQFDVVIVGAGPAGMTAALYTGRAMLKTVVLERGEPGGELLNTEYLDDVIGFPKILGRDLAEKFSAHAQQFGAEFQQFVNVQSVKKLEDGSFETRTDIGDVYRSPVVIATAGGTPLKLGIHLAWRAARISDHDALIGRKLATIMAGGEVPHPTTVSEQHLLDLEREAFLSLVGERKTRDRIQHTLKTGKPLRN